MTVSLLLHSQSHEETRQIGQKIGEQATTGLLIALTGTLGSGKTVLIQGLAKGLLVPDGYYVTSPSYTLMNEYPGRLPLIHLDIYRLSDMDFDDIGLNDILENDTAVVAIEWAERLPSGSLREYLSVQMDILEDDTRNITLLAYGRQPEQIISQLKC